MSDGQTNNLVISERSTIQLTVARAILAAAVLIPLVGSSAVAWYALNHKTDDHIADDRRHLDKSFEREHGAPVGKWDLSARDEQAKRAFEALQAQVDAIKLRQDSLSAEVDNRKPRWRP